MKKLLLILFVALTHVISTAQPCEPPTSLTVSSITSSSATFSWTNPGSAMLWQVLVLPTGSTAPTVNETGMVSTVNPFYFTGLNCLTTYDVYVRTECSQADMSAWTGPVVFTTGMCTGQPQDMMQCVNETTGLACFDINQNDPNILGTLNPADYTVTYHLNQSDAAVNINPLNTANDYCFSTGGASWAMQTIWARLTEDASGMYWVYPFNLSAQTTVTAPTLNGMVQCDEDNDGQVIFNLTSAAAQIITLNSLEYYYNIEDASAMVNAIPDPTQYIINTTSPLATVFIRETVIGDCDIIHMLPVNGMSNCNVANMCVGANSLCNSLGIPFSNTVNVQNAEPGNEYACLGSEPNPTWFYLPVSSPGFISLIIQQSQDINVTSGTLDVDFICYGPFTNPTTPCSGMLTNANVVACSYSTSATEFVSIPNALAGQYYLIMVTNFSNMPGYIKIVEDGTSQGTIDCTGIRLNAFLDSNSNGTKEAGEPNFPLGQFNYELNNDGNIHNIISPTGVYNIYDTNASNSYDFGYTIDAAYIGNYALTTASYSNITVVPGAGMQDYYFPVTITNTYNDLAVSIVPDQAPRPGFTYNNTVIYTNLGNQTTAAGTVSFDHDPLVTIVANTQIGTVATATGFIYDFTNLAPFESRQMTVTMQVPTIPTVTLGNLLTNTANVTPLTGDVFLENNFAESSQVIIGSYDPNDKMESRGEQILITDFTSEDYLYYTIRFENTGTANAINVRITDVLDNRLDESSIRMVSASHDYVLDRMGSQLTWSFDNILLPSSQSASPLPSNGYVQFKVKPNPGYAVGDIIPNTASIFFDFNPAIVTNTFNSEFVSVLAVNQFNTDAFVVYPNPASTEVHISMGRGNSFITNVTIYDMMGKNILSTSPASQTATQSMDISGINSGIYFIEIISADKQKTVKKLVIQ